MAQTGGLPLLAVYQPGLMPVSKLPLTTKSSVHVHLRIPSGSTFEAPLTGDCKTGAGAGLPNRKVGKQKAYKETHKIPRCHIKAQNNMSGNGSGKREQGADRKPD